jgi:hypothetical protein
MSEKITLHATVAQLDETSIEVIAKKREIVLPSEHLALFVASLAPLEDANQNGVRLSEEASRKFLTTINQAQVNFEHFGRGFICGAVIDSWIDEATKETKVAFTFHKMIYAEEYIIALGLMAEGQLAVSFELLADKSTKEELSDGTVRLNDFTYTGMGFLLDNPPAYKNANVFEFATRVKNRIQKYDTKEVMFASEVMETCEDILGQGEEVVEMPSTIFIVTSSDDRHFHVAEVDFDGNGRTISGHGEGKHPEAHMIVNWQIQVAKNANPDTGEHTHRILNEIMATVKDIIKSRKTDKSLEQKGGNKSMNSEETKKVEDIRAELGDYAKDVSDEDLLNEDKVNELRQAKTDAESKTEKSKDKSKEKSEEKAEEEDAEDKVDDTEEKIESEEDKKEEESEEDKKEEESEEDKKEEESEEDKEEASKKDKDTRIAELEKENKELKAESEAKNSEIKTVRENAEKIGKLKVELANNPHVKDFSDEDYLDENQVKQAKLQKENDDIKAENEELKKAKKDKSDDAKEKEKHEAVETGSKDSKDKTFNEIIKEDYDRSRSRNTKKDSE